MSRVSTSILCTLNRTTTKPAQSILLRRKFTSSAWRHLRSTELDPANLNNLRVKPERLWETIHSTARWTQPRKDAQLPDNGDAAVDIKTAGLSRLTLSQEDKIARDWFVRETESLGCKTHIDAVGNIFAVRPGLNNDVPATFVGSHLDSQPSGGRFDGILGVAAGVEMLRVLNENWIETEGPVGVVNWTNEEGAKFPVSMMGSGVWSGRLPIEEAWNTRSVSQPSTTVKEDLERIGYLGGVPSNSKDMPVGAHFELHIEQGPRLEKEGKAIGVVTGVQAYKWFNITITGRESHAGTTAFEDRADPVYWAAGFIKKSHKIVESFKGLMTVGRFSVTPGSVNTVPGQVQMSLDIRNPSDQSLKRTEAKIRDIFTRVNDGQVVRVEKDTFKKGKTEIKKTGQTLGSPELHANPLTRITVSIQEIFASAATTFHPDAVRCIEESAVGLLGDEDKMQHMPSGAGHDSVNTNLHCPTGMIFVPCKDGVSHNPAEWCEEEDCATGANVLLHSVLRMDRMRKEKGEFD